MFTSLSLRTLFKNQPCFLRMVQTLSVLDKASNNSFLQVKEDNSQIQSVNDEITIADKIPYIKPKTISSCYINESETLQELFKLNVDIHKVEQNVEAYEYILQQKFVDIKEHIIFLKKLNLENVEIGKIITKNPFILKEDLENLKVRINYLKYKRFTDHMIQEVVKKNPFWLTHT